MPSKISEKKLLTGFIFVAVGIFILFKTSVVQSPVRLSEPGILFTLIATCLLVFGIRLFKQAFEKI